MPNTRRRIGLAAEHIEAEDLILEEFARKSKKRVSFRRETRTLNFVTQNCAIKVDGWSDNPPILVEVWSSAGTPLPAQRHKIANDALKLIFLAMKRGRTHKKFILFADKEAQRPFISETWIASCLKEYGIKTEVIEIPPEKLEGLIKARIRLRR